MKTSLLECVGSFHKMATTIEKKIHDFAIQSRFAVFVLQLLFNALIPDHDAQVFNPTQNRTWNHMDQIVDLHFSGFVRWDGVYYLHIAEHGYTYENCLAFFPFYPLFIRTLSNTVFMPLQYLMNYRSVLIISAIVINHIAFIKCAKLLYRLGQRILNEDVLAYKAALLFCINPASIFMSAAYSESTFAFLVFSGMLHFEHQKKISSAVTFGLGSLVRSNGLVNIGFELHHKAKESVKQFFNYSRILQSGFEKFMFVCWSQFLFIVIPAVVITFLGFFPFAVYQYYAYTIFCNDTNNAIPQHLVDYADSEGYLVRGSRMPSWCHNFIPLSYSAIQKNHWGVGLFQYYEMRQIPNFILATPVTVLSVVCVWNYYRLNKKTVLTLDLFRDAFHDKEITEDYIFNNRRLLPYIIHLLFLTLCGLVFMHVQVTTRFIFSSSPVLYWFVADLITSKTMYKQTPKVNKYDVWSIQKSEKSNSIERNSTNSFRNILMDQFLNFGAQSFITKILLLYFISYFAIGTIMFCNFLPWT